MDLDGLVVRVGKIDTDTVLGGRCPEKPPCRNTPARVRQIEHVVIKVGVPRMIAVRTSEIDGQILHRAITIGVAQIAHDERVAIPSERDALNIDDAIDITADRDLEGPALGCTRRVDRLKFDSGARAEVLASDVEDVETGSTGDEVPTDAARQHIVAHTTDNQIVAVTTINVIDPISARDDLVVVGTLNRVSAATRCK